MGGAGGTRGVEEAHVRVEANLSGEKQDGEANSLVAPRRSHTGACYGCPDLCEDGVPLHVHEEHPRQHKSHSPPPPLLPSPPHLREDNRLVFHGGRVQQNRPSSPHHAKRSILLHPHVQPQPQNLFPWQRGRGRGACELIGLEAAGLDLLHYEFAVAVNDSEQPEDPRGRVLVLTGLTSGAAGTQARHLLGWFLSAEGPPLAKVPRELR
eukprot:306636-Hanusia_phi.AAC.5